LPFSCLEIMISLLRKPLYFFMFGGTEG
jgi:hypothetical protein